MDHYSARAGSACAQIGHDVLGSAVRGSSPGKQAYAERRENHPKAANGESATMVVGLSGARLPVRRPFLQFLRRRNVLATLKDVRGSPAESLVQNGGVGPHRGRKVTLS